MECRNHPGTMALERCTGCAEPFCQNCLVDVQGQRFCNSCKVMAVQGAPACNGWQFWCVNVEGKRVPIDMLRQKLRAQLN